MKKMPQVCGVCVGFHKTNALVEFDCPHCGATHTVSVSDEAFPPLGLATPCGRAVSLCSMVAQAHDGDQ